MGCDIGDCSLIPSDIDKYDIRDVSIKCIDHVYDRYQLELSLSNNFRYVSVTAEAFGPIALPARQELLSQALVFISNNGDKFDIINKKTKLAVAASCVILGVSIVEAND